LRGESSLVRRSGIHRPRCTAWRDGGSRAILALRKPRARLPAGVPDSRARSASASWQYQRAAGAVPRHFADMALSPCAEFRRGTPIPAPCLRGQVLVSRFWMRGAEQHGARHQSYVWSARNPGKSSPAMAGSRLRRAASLCPIFLKPRGRGETDYSIRKSKVKMRG
jgi:hypothetical protein